MYSPDDVPMERLHEQAPLHTHPASYEGASEAALGPTWLPDPMAGQDSGEQLPSLCA